MMFNTYFVILLITNTMKQIPFRCTRRFPLPAVWGAVFGNFYLKLPCSGTDQNSFCTFLTCQLTDIGTSLLITKLQYPTVCRPFFSIYNNIDSAYSLQSLTYLHICYEHQNRLKKKIPDRTHAATCPSRRQHVSVTTL